MLYDPSHFVLQQLDLTCNSFDFYHSRLKMFHVKDAEFRPTGKQGVYGGYQPWLQRAGRFRSLGDGQVDFATIFSKLTQYDFSRLGHSRMGVLHQKQRTGRQRRRSFHQTPHHRSRQKHL